MEDPDQPNLENNHANPVDGLEHLEISQHPQEEMELDHEQRDETLGCYQFKDGVLDERFIQVLHEVVHQPVPSSATRAEYGVCTDGKCQHPQTHVPVITVMDGFNRPKKVCILAYTRRKGYKDLPHWEAGEFRIHFIGFPCINCTPWKVENIVLCQNMGRSEACTFKPVDPYEALENHELHYRLNSIGFCLACSLSLFPDGASERLLESRLWCGYNVRSKKGKCKTCGTASLPKDYAANCRECWLKLNPLVATNEQIWRASIYLGKNPTAAKNLCTIGGTRNCSIWLDGHLRCLTCFISQTDLPSPKSWEEFAEANCLDCEEIIGRCLYCPLRPGAQPNMDKVELNALGYCRLCYAQLLDIIIQSSKTLGINETQKSFLKFQKKDSSSRPTCILCKKDDWDLSAGRTCRRCFAHLFTHIQPDSPLEYKQVFRLHCGFRDHNKNGVDCKSKKTNIYRLCKPHFLESQGAVQLNECLFCRKTSLKCDRHGRSCKICSLLGISCCYPDDSQPVQDLVTLAQSLASKTMDMRLLRCPFLDSMDSPTGREPHAKAYTIARAGLHALHDSISSLGDSLRESQLEALTKVQTIIRQDDRRTTAMLARTFSNLKLNWASVQPTLSGSSTEALFWRSVIRETVLRLDTVDLSMGDLPLRDHTSSIRNEGRPAIIREASCWFFEVFGQDFDSAKQRETFYEVTMRIDLPILLPLDANFVRQHKLLSFEFLPDFAIEPESEYQQTWGTVLANFTLRYLAGFQGTQEDLYAAAGALVGSILSRRTQGGKRWSSLGIVGGIELWRENFGQTPTMFRLLPKIDLAGTVFKTANVKGQNDRARRFQYLVVLQQVVNHLVAGETLAQAWNTVMEKLNKYSIPGAVTDNSWFVICPNCTRPCPRILQDRPQSSVMDVVCCLRCSGDAYRTAHKYGPKARATNRTTFQDSLVARHLNIHIAKDMQHYTHCKDVRLALPWSPDHELYTEELGGAIEGGKFWWRNYLNPGGPETMLADKPILKQLPSSPQPVLDHSLTASVDGIHQFHELPEGVFGYHVRGNLAIMPRAANTFCTNHPKICLVAAQIARDAKTEADLDFAAMLLGACSEMLMQYYSQTLVLRISIVQEWEPHERRTQINAERTGLRLNPALTKRSKCGVQYRDCSDLASSFDDAYDLVPSDPSFNIHFNELLEAMKTVHRHIQKDCSILNAMRPDRPGRGSDYFSDFSEEFWLQQAMPDGPSVFTFFSTRGIDYFSVLPWTRAQAATIFNHLRWNMMARCDKHHTASAKLSPEARTTVDEDDCDPEEQDRLIDDDGDMNPTGSENHHSTHDPIWLPGRSGPSLPYEAGKSAVRCDEAFEDDSEERAEIDYHCMTTETFILSLFWLFLARCEKIQDSITGRVLWTARDPSGMEYVPWSNWPNSISIAHEHHGKPMTSGYSLGSWNPSDQRIPHDVLDWSLERNNLALETKAFNWARHTSPPEAKSSIVQALYVNPGTSLWRQVVQNRDMLLTHTCRCPGHYKKTPGSNPILPRCTCGRNTWATADTQTLSNALV